MTELQIITSNNGKLREFKEIFGDSKYVPVQNNIDYPEIQASNDLQLCKLQQCNSLKEILYLIPRKRWQEKIQMKN